MTRMSISVVVIGALLLSACAGNDAQTEPDPSGSAAATELAVTEAEFSIRLPSRALPPGRYTFSVTNEGTKPHDLVILGPGVDNARTRIMQNGERGKVTVTLQPGTYQVWCSVGNHRAHGMDTTISVA